MRPIKATLDHLVVAAVTLADGIDYITDLTGIAPQPGGRHVAMGTHNALLRLGERLYLEVIAIDPDGATPSRPRWFDLDNIAVQAELAEQPRLIHWVARTSEIERAVELCPMPLGPLHAFERGRYRWRITVPDDGSRPAGGVFPTLIAWDVPQHPADALPSAPIALTCVSATHREPAPIRAALAAFGLSDTLKVTYDRETRLAAMLATPRGVVTLAS